MSRSSKQQHNSAAVARLLGWFWLVAVFGGAVAETATRVGDSSGGAKDEIPTVVIGRDVNGIDVVMPMIGAGTWQYNDTVAYQSVCKVFQQGKYTFVDTAFGYRNQKGVGRAIRDCWQGKPSSVHDHALGEGRNSRDDLFVMTKIPGGLNASQVHAAHLQNLIELQLDYVDHLMTHFPADWEVTVASKKARQEEWLALEEIYKSGKARSIGISHYCPQHIEDILEVATVMPSINQVEYHVGSQDIDGVIETCRKHGITFMSFSPLCGPCDIQDPSEDSLIHGRLVSDVAGRYRHSDDDAAVTPSQAALRYIVQQGIPVIPKSNSEDHIVSNRKIFDFALSKEDMALLGSATQPTAEGGDCDVP